MFLLSRFLLSSSSSPVPCSLPLLCHCCCFFFFFFFFWLHRLSICMCVIKRLSSSALSLSHSRARLFFLLRLPQSSDDPFTLLVHNRSLSNLSLLCAKWTPSWAYSFLLFNSSSIEALLLVLFFFLLNFKKLSFVVIGLLFSLLYSTAAPPHM